ncbi:hypothetical protein [Streptacidiphilus jiangxiensis]|uniref:Uncharacterized protein n=1 Tax=Streptacidiphilus jiangxiensis TaxID=235985 RepID=A0A1H7TIZ4_STRJI|nr:hypothetical protein [Streptacidiphilus jiangxiensis]SEL84852.1 hypothetical protein SAMN05414137_11419 [Streptacidiphilus jiangxiensis]
MTGEVLVRWLPRGGWWPRSSGRAKLWVVIDGLQVAEVDRRVGHLRMPLPVGQHTVRVGRALARSNAVTVEVAEGGLVRLGARSLPLVSLGYALAGYVVGILAISVSMPAGALLFALLVGVDWGVPGIYWRLRASTGPAGPSPASAEAAEDRWAAQLESVSAANGLWWESDPRFAKRFGKGK